MSELHSGFRLNARFTLLRPLVQGGMGEVWVVHDGELDEESRARILPAGLSEDLIERLRRECSSARRLQHPNIVPVYDFHRGAAGHRFTTMALVEGEDARALRGRPVVEVLKRVVPLADALSYAHGAGVVHRDLKVSNVLIDAREQPWLIDFGIAAILADTQLRGGDARYNVSPQQLSGEAAHLSDDVYGFGVLLYELISGHAPLGSDPSPDRVLSERPAPLASSQPLPPRLQTLVAAMLEKSPPRRPADLAAVRRELEEILGESSAAAAPTPPSMPPLHSPLVEAVAPTTPSPEVTSLAVFSAPVAKPSSSRAPQEHGAGKSRRLWVVLLAALGLGLMQLLLSLPDWLSTEETTAADPSPAPMDETVTASVDEPEAAQSPPPIADVRERSYLRDRAGEALHKASQLQADLEDKAVSVWGGEDYQKATQRLAKGSEALGSGNYGAADSTLRAAGRLFQMVASRADSVVRQALADGRELLERGDASAAAAAFHLASQIRPGDDPDGDTARRSLRSAEAYDKVQAYLEEGRRSERQDALGQAEAAYAAALGLDPGAAAAKEGLARVQSKRRDDAFSRHLSQGLAALEKGDYDAARKALGQARRINPQASAVPDVLNRVDAAERAATLSRHQASAAELMEAERWVDAAAKYQAALDIDPTLAFALEGKVRAEARDKMVRDLDAYIANPQDLSADSTFAAASQLLEEAELKQLSGPRHRQQMTQLRPILSVMGQPMRAVIESDGKTEVTVYQVGRLGTFEMRELELRPGVYTVVGQRRGYRDVRLQLVVQPGQEPEPLAVLCKEKI